MIHAVSWYLTLTILGWLTFPLTFWLFGNLRDRGYAFSRALGLLLWGYLFWALASFRIALNNAGGIFLALLILLAVSLFLSRKIGLAAFRAWWQENRRQVWMMEGLFAAAYLLMALIRAANPDALGTEKPMELAFINAILRSPTFPPHDPWLSGYAISYYHFGYILVAMLAKFTATPGSVAFNLGVTLVFSLSVISAYGLVANLLSTRLNQKSLSLPLLGPLMTVIVGNWEGFLEILHSAGLFWRLENGQWVSPFWKWLDLVELTNPPQTPFQWLPSRWYWWWRASRVVQDYDVAGGFREVIDEFPAFSYVLADLHPHVLAMPFAFLAMALGLNLILNPPSPLAARPQLKLPFTRLTLRYPLSIPLEQGWASALLLGGMAFLNTWDFPIYVALCAGAYALWKQYHPEAERQPLYPTILPRIPLPAPYRQMALDVFLYGLWCGVMGVLLYLPFYLSFASQASGILPNLVYPTRGAHLWIMFGPLWLPILGWLAVKLRAERANLRAPLLLSLGFIFALWLLSLALGVGISLIPKIGDIYLGSIAAANISSWLVVAIQRRLLYFAGWLSLTAILAACLALLGNALARPQSAGAQKSAPSTIGDRSIAANHYLLLLILGGVLLVILPDFFFLRDQFGWRINTVFKFYYQAWLLWGISSAAALANLISSHKIPWRPIILTLAVLGVALGLIYPLLATLTLTNNFNPPNGWTLDSTAYLRRQDPLEMSAIDWLSRAPLGVVAEAVSYTGGSYTQYARVATLSGQPSVLGWTGHESQWRGGAQEMGSRQPDIERLYCTKNWLEAVEIIRQYQIRYIFVGELERSTYKPGAGNCQNGLVETKFQANLLPAFQQGSLTIYLVPDTFLTTPK
ncbi:MAG: DUF2298 domain-containing protein [Chloroflexota bacterium]